MLDEKVVSSLVACTTWEDYTCMFNATQYFKFVLAKECTRSCQSVSYNVAEKIQHFVPSYWVREKLTEL